MDNRKFTVAVDAMGGDFAPCSVIVGLDSIYDYLNENGIHLLLFGDTMALAPLLLKCSRLNNISTVVQADDVVSGDDKPSRIIRSGRKTSMWMAIESVRNKKADAVISSGNTGCLMAISKILISMIEGVRRPAITTTLPSINGGGIVMLDLGANAECDEVNIFQFCLMGAIYSSIMLDKKCPNVGILNIGSESGKGLEYLSKTVNIIEAKKSKLCYNYFGFVEGDDIFKGKVDVIATDGFTGNVALKTIEGTAKFITNDLKKTLKKSILSKIGVIFILSALNKFKGRMDPRKYNGAVFLGLDGIVVKSHGGADAVGFANAMKYACQLLAGDFANKVKIAIERVNEE